MYHLTKKYYKIQSLSGSLPISLCAKWKLSTFLCKFLVSKCYCLLTPFQKHFKQFQLWKKLLFYLTFTELFNHFYGNNQVLKKLCLIELTRTRKIRWVLAIFQTRTQKTPDPLRWPKPELKKTENWNSMKDGQNCLSNP